VNLKENIKKVLKEEINKFELVKNLIYDIFDSVIFLEYNTERNEIMVYYDKQEVLDNSEICDVINNYTGLNVVPWYEYDKNRIGKEPDFYIDSEGYEEELNENYSPAGKEITPNKIVIHKSSPVWRESILKIGLQASAGDCYKTYVGYGEKCIPAIFATNSTNKRAWFDSTYNDDVWGINTEMIPDVKWYKDKHFESRSKHIVTFENIPPKAIKLIHEGTGKDWGIMESVDESEDKKLKLVTKMIHEFFDEVSFIKIKKYENKPLIRVYFDNDEYAGNEESYFAEQIQDKIYKYTGIKLIPYWHTIQYNTDADFRLDAIKLKYDNEGNVINESEEKKPKYLNIIKDIVEPYKKEECVCDINVSYNDEDDMYSVYLVFGVEDLNDTFIGNGAHHYVLKLKNDVKDTIKSYLPINELYVGSYGTQKCDRKPMNESKNNSNKNVIEGILNSMVLPEYEHVICDIKVKDPSERFNTFGETPFKSPSIHVTFIGGYGTKLWPVTQGVKINYDNVMDDIWNIIYDYTGIAVDIYSSTKKDCEKKTIHIKESTKKELRILKENTKRLDPFIDEILSVHKMSNELIDFIKKFIEESNCKRIDFSKFKMGVMGVALETGVLINRTALNQSLPFLLFLIFHEITHQYQFKKYGEKVMYDCYIGNVSEIEGAEFMKHTEEVADDLASRKIRELQKLGLIGEYTPMQMYKNLPIEQIKMMVNHFRNEMRIKNIQSPKKVSEYFYNIVKSEI